MERDSEIVKAFERFRSRILRLKVERWNGRVVTGTAWVAARRSQSRRVGVVTARHVVPGVRDEDVREARLTVQRVGDTGQIEAEVSLTVSDDTASERFGRFSEPLDLAYFEVPANDKDGRVVFADKEGGLPIIGGPYGPGPGTRVAWAGYCGLLANTVGDGSAPLCYFEGTVSAFVDRGEARNQYLVVDGHARQGVSGGPLWYWNGDKGRVEVAGVVSRYVQAIDGDEESRVRTPGFVVARPIHSLYEALSVENSAG